MPKTTPLTMPNARYKYGLHRVMSTCMFPPGSRYRDAREKVRAFIHSVSMDVVRTHGRINSAAIGQLERVRRAAKVLMLIDVAFRSDSRLLLPDGTLDILHDGVKDLLAAEHVAVNQISSAIERLNIPFGAGGDDELKALLLGNVGDVAAHGVIGNGRVEHVTPGNDAAQGASGVDVDQQVVDSQVVGGNAQETR